MTARILTVAQALVVVVALVAAVPAWTEELEPVEPLAVDPDDLAALLADLEAQGGVLEADELAWLVGSVRRPARRARAEVPRDRVTGEVLAGTDWREGAAPRPDARAQVAVDRVLLGGVRWRRDPAGEVTAAWATAGGSWWRLAGGTGSLSSGFGLMAAGLGARSSLDVDASLLPPGSGWRPSLSVTAPQRLQAVVVDLSPGSLFAAGGGVAQDPRGLTARHVQLRAGDPRRTGVLATARQHGASRAGGLDLRAAAGPWLVAAEAATWRLEVTEPAGRALTATAGWRDRRWRIEVQVAAARAAAGMPGAQRPASLPGWDGEGWAGRVSGRTDGGVRLGLLASSGRDRRPDAATGQRRTRHVLGASVGGVWSAWSGAAGAWQLRWRRVDEARHAWDPAQPWLPAALDRQRSRSWLTLRATHDVAGGTAEVSWRRLEEAGQARNVLGARYQRRQAGWRWRGGVMTAWGEPLDLVTVSAPVSSLLRPRHWGHWDSSVWAGCEGTGRWRWQLGGELRRRSAAAGGGVVAEARAQWGRVF